MQNKSFGNNIMQGIRLRIGKIFQNPYRAVNIGPVKKIYYKHLNPGKIRSHRLFGRDLYFISSTELLHGIKEVFIEENYRQNLHGKPYIIDCGANIGLSVIYLKRSYPDAEILAFEPDDRNFSLLKKNVDSFGFTEVVLRKEAIWIKDGPVSFLSQGSMDSKISVGGSEDSNFVTGTRLKKYLNRNVDFLKIDIEGAEYEVLMDLGESLKTVKNIFIEYHGFFNQNYQLTDVLKLLSDNGFRYYIKEAYPIFQHPLSGVKNSNMPFDIQLNIFGINNNK